MGFFWVCAGVALVLFALLSGVALCIRAMPTEQRAEKRSNIRRVS